MKARVRITRKRDALDPEGRAIAEALGALGFDGVRGVRQGKSIEIELAETDPQAARAQVEAMCAQLLANSAIEDYEIVLDA